MAQAPDPLIALGPAPSTNAGDNLQRINATPDAFGAGVGASLVNFGATLGAVGKATNETAIAEQGIANETMANDARNAGVIELTKAWSDYHRKEGKDAVAGFEDFQKQAFDIMKTQGSTLNPAAQKMFNSVSSRYLDQYMIGATTYRDAQDKEWQKTSSLATQELSTSQAVMFRNNEGATIANADAAAAEARKRSESIGEDENTARAKVALSYGKTYSTVLSAMAADPDPAAPLRAQSLFEKVRGNMDGASQARVAEMLKPRVDKAQVDGAFLLVTHQGPAAFPSSVNPEDVWAAQMGVESGGQQFGKDGKVLTSPAGAQGKAQVMPATADQVQRDLGLTPDPARMASDPAYNEMIGKAYKGQMLTKYDGNQTLATAAYNAGPGRVDEWIQKFGDPRKGQISDGDFAKQIPIDETRNYVARTVTLVAGSKSDGSAGDVTPHPIDGPAMVEQAMKMFPDDPEKQLSLVSKVHAYIGARQSVTEQARFAMGNKLKDLNAQFMDGSGLDAAVPEVEIRSLFKPEQADKMISELNLSKTAGTILSGVKLATPQDLDGMRDDLEHGSGVLSSALKGKGAMLRNVDNTVQPGEDQAKADYRMRKQIAGKLEEAIQKRNAAILTDPALYVRQNDPTVAAAGHMEGGDITPEQQQAWGNATLAAQARLGVPEAKRSLLTKEEATDFVAMATKGNPAELDVQQALGGIAKQYGPLWPKVFGDLVKAKLPPTYQVLAQMDGPDQAGDAASMQEALRFADEKGGIQKMRDLAPKDKAKAVDDSIDAAMAPFASTVANSWGGLDTLKSYQDSVRTLAYSYAIKGVDGSTAVQRAVDGVFRKWDMKSTWRVPKPLSNAATTAAEGILSNLKPEDLAAPTERAPGLTDADAQKGMWNGVRNTGTWLNNNDSSGIYLAQMERGIYQPVRAKNGARIEFKFDAIPSVSADRPVSSWMLNNPSP